MKPSFTRLLKFVFAILLPAVAFSQQTDYTLALNTGKFIPEANSSTVSKQSAIFQRTYFAGKNYMVLQFNTIPTQAQKDIIAASGIELIDYLPKNAYTAAVPAGLDWSRFPAMSVRSVLYLTADQKAMLPVLQGNAPQHAITEQGYVNLQVHTYEKLSISEIREAVSTVAGRIINDAPIFRLFSIRVPKENVRQLAELPFIQWMEFADPPNQTENRPGVTQHHVNILHDGPRNLKGDGMSVGAWDEICFPHLDFSPSGRMVNVNPGAGGQHGTHLSGTIAGRGLINPIARGMAPNATLFSYNGYDGPAGGGHFDNNLLEMATEIPARQMIASNHSYHDGLGVAPCTLGATSNAYTLRSRNADLNLNNHTFHLHCHSAGNAQGSCANGWLTITGTGKSAKNNIVVGALTSTDGMTTFSSFGPVSDGRVKPEICAFGNGVLSTNNSSVTPYASLSGTSMATPGIAGTLTVIAQHYKQLNGNVLPPSALIKNVACNTAQDLGNPGPDYRFGFGRVNALKAVRIIEENRYALNTVAQGGLNDVAITVPAGAAKLNVMLTWNDPAGAANAATPLVNNLDLTVSDGTTTTLPWILNPNSPASNATKAVDNISNIEQVTIDNPPPGNYVFRVTGTSVPTGPTQAYALTWNVEMPYIEVTYPNGGETLNPGTTEVLSWDNAGVTGNQTLEYSLDGSTNWVLISNIVPSTAYRFNWTVPAAFTSTARIRVTSGTLTDMSDNGFKILGTVTGFTGSGAACNAGEVIFNWTAVTNATHYDIYRLDPTTGYFVLLSGNVTGTTHTATGLTPNTSMWFTIRAKNNTNSAESERALAINVTTSNGGGGLGAVGSISGQSAVCGNQSGIVYSITAVPGATNYIWTVPVGATIVSGQGTTSITVNFTAGANGNITVAASNGTCQTAPSTLAVTTGSAAAAPTSGGDQAQAVCPGGVVPTLTATASAPSGFTVVWYTAATGGTVVSSPTLSSPGTITYYAASRETATGCESITRTPVTLTINQVPPASIAAGGPTTFCQGGSVTLTANSGGSYLWNTGATTQSITVSAAGNYSVTVTTGSCNSTSPVTNVVVNPTPTASVSAGGATTFCAGLNVVLTASAGSSWLWSNGATTQSITVTSSGNYSVTVTNSSGCSATSAPTAVTVNPNPPAVVNASGATAFCQGGSVTLTANSGNAYLWSNGATTQSITVNGPLGTTNYTVQVTQAGGCVSTSPATAVTVNPIPPANITAGGTTTFCQGGSVTLTASAGSAWAWSNGATTQSINVTNSGNYSVTVTNSSGCSASSSATTVAVSANPTVTISAAPYTSLVPDQKTTLTANVTPAGTYSYAWFKNGVAVPGATSSTLPNIGLDQIGSYTVTVQNTTGLPCSNTSNALAIDAAVSARLFIWPNPNEGEFSLSYYSAGQEQYTIVISDGRGALVYKRAVAITAPYQRIAIDLRGHGRGVYNIGLFNKAGKRIATGQVVTE